MKHHRQFLTTFFVVALALAPVCTMGTDAPASSTATPVAALFLQDQAAALAAAFERAGHGRVGIAAVDLLTNQQVITVRGDEPLMPASNQKLLTSIFALERLGPDFRFATGAFLMSDDVVVSGEFDPTFGDPRIAGENGRTIYTDLDRWSVAIRKALAGSAPRPAGATQPAESAPARAATVRNILVVAPPDFPARHPDWPARHHDKWYGAPVSTLNFNDNCVDVSFIGSGAGLMPVVSPVSSLIRVDNRLKIIPGHDNVWSIRGVGDEATFVLAGTAGRAGDEPFSTAVDNPDLMLGRCFADRLERAGVKVTGEVRRVLPGQVNWARARPVAATLTTLFTALHRANKHSLNMAAECVLLRAGDGTWAGSTQMLARDLTERFRLPQGSIVAVDGSGLSRGNRVTASAMATVLAGAARRSYALVLLHSLPIGGADGTLERRFADKACRGRVLGKTGTLAGVSTLSGYVLNERGQVRYSFSVLGNGLRHGSSPAKQIQERICELLYEQAVVVQGGPTQSTQQQEEKKQP